MVVNVVINFYDCHDGFFFFHDDDDDNNKNKDE